MADAQVFLSLYFSAWSYKSCFKLLVVSSVFLLVGNAVYALPFDFHSITILLIGHLFCGLGSARTSMGATSVIAYHLKFACRLHQVSLVRVPSECLVVLLLACCGFEVYKLTSNRGTLPGWVMTLSWLIYLIWSWFSFIEPSHEIEESNPGQESNAVLASSKTHAHCLHEPRAKLAAGKAWYILSNVFMASYFLLLTWAIREHTNWGRDNPTEAPIYCGLASLLVYFLLVDRFFDFCVWILTASPGPKYSSLLALACLTGLFWAAHRAAALASKDNIIFQLSFFVLIMGFTTYAAWKAPDERGRNISKLVGAGCWGTAVSLLDPNDFEPRAALFFFMSSIFCLGCNIFHPSYNQGTGGSRTRRIRDSFLSALGIDNVIAGDEQPEDQQANQNVLENDQNQPANGTVQDQQANQNFFLPNVQHQPAK